MPLAIVILAQRRPAHEVGEVQGASAVEVRGQAPRHRRRRVGPMLEGQIWGVPRETEGRVNSADPRSRASACGLLSLQDAGSSW